MTDVAAQPTPAPATLFSRALPWLRSKDPGYAFVKRSVRAAVVMPSVFAVAEAFFSNSNVALFGAFGSFVVLLLVDYTGSLRDRFLSYAGVFVASSALIVVGTVVSSYEVAAVVVTVPVVFGVLFAGILTPRAAAASTVLLIFYVLPVAYAQPASQVGWRLVGFALGAGVAIPACLFIWPSAYHGPLRKQLSAALEAMARLAEARTHDDPDPKWQAAVDHDLADLRLQFSSTPYPQAGSAGAAIALSKLVGRIEWVAGTSGALGSDDWSDEPASARRVTEQAAVTLHRTASLVCDDDGRPVADPHLVEQLQRSAGRLGALIRAEVRADVDDVASSDTEVPAVEGEAITATLDPGFHARVLGITTELVADAALEGAGAESVLDRRIATSEGKRYSSTLRLAASHLSFSSVWFRNSLRGAIGLTIAVGVIEVTEVSHAFWVLLGALSVLRSNALGTGASALRAVGGTAIGVVIGSSIVFGVGNHVVLLWFLLPLAVFVAGMAPSLIGFAAGQAAFTLMVIILFNILAPVGWKVGITRIEDVAIGCGISVVVGLFFWPRGATAALGRALSSSFVASATYLQTAVERLTMTSQHIDIGPDELAAQEAFFLLEDAFRQFLNERGAKPVPVDTITRLFTGSNRLRMAAYTLTTLAVHPPASGRPEVESVAVAEAVLRDSFASSLRWYVQFAELLGDERSSIDPLPPHGEVLHHALRAAVDDVRTQHRDDRVPTTLSMLWADELLEGERQLQDELLASADLFARARRGMLV